ncbi:MAG: hypothetical protein AB1351_12545 [Thermoproteota archaeon]
MQEKKVKVAIGAGMIGIGAILLLSGFLNKIDHDRCVAEGRAFLDEFYNTPRAATFSCIPDISGSLFVIGSTVKAIGIIVMILALMNVSFVSLSRTK